MPDPDVLAGLLARYRAARDRDDGDGGGSREARRRVEDAAYLLCVSTGTGDIADALAVARRRLTRTTLEPALMR